MATKMTTTETDASVTAFLARIPQESVREDCAALIQMMSAITGSAAKMWGASIVGFDKFRYRYADGKPGEICLIGFSPRKQNVVLYVTDDHERDADLLAKLGSVKCGKSCIYMNQLDELHMPTLKQLIRRAVKARRAASVR
jgi:hypothetical protein